MGALIAIIWLVGTIASIWFIVRPSPSLPIYATRGRAIATGAVIFIGLPIIAAVTGLSKMASSPTKAAASQTADSGSTTDGNGQAAVAATPASPWTYNETKDEMRGTTTKFAQTLSNETFPNSIGVGDEQNTVLEVQKQPKGYDVDINNPNLQFTCGSLVTKQVTVKFDDGPIEHYDCTGSVGDKFGLAYLTTGDRFVSKLRTAKRVMIEAEVFQRGDVQMSFNVGGFTL
jgi:invasion protein IalB